MRLNEVLQRKCFGHNRLEAEIGWNVEHLCVWRYGVREPDVGSDDASRSNDRLTAENAGSGIDGDFVFDGRMSLAAGIFVALSLLMLLVK